MIGYDEGIKLVLSGGKVLDNILGNIYGTTVGFDVGTEIGSLDGLIYISNEG